jgi:hypothetical protein
MEEGSLSRLLNEGKVIPLWKETLKCSKSSPSSRCDVGRQHAVIRRGNELFVCNELKTAAPRLSVHVFHIKFRLNFSLDCLDIELIQRYCFS